MALPEVRINYCGVVRCEPSWSWSPTLTDYDLWFAFAGDGRMTVDGVERTVMPGYIALLAPGSVVSAWQNPLNRLGVCYLHFDFVRSGRVMRTAPADLPPRFAHLDDVDTHERILRRLVSVFTADPRSAQARLLLQATLLAMASARPGPPDKPESQLDRRLRDIEQFIREYPGRPYSVTALSESIDCSADHLTRRFKALFGLTLKEHILRCRTDRARTLLRQTPMTITEIASSLGYGDLFQFSRQFRQRTGVSPSDFRSSRN